MSLISIHCLVSVLLLISRVNSSELDQLNLAVAEFAHAALQSLAGVADPFPPQLLPGSIWYSSGRGLVPLTGSLSQVQISGLTSLQNISVTVDFRPPGTPTEPNMRINMEIVSPRIQGMYNLNGHIGNSIVLSGEGNWTIVPSSVYPLRVSCPLKLTTQGGYLSLGNCTDNSGYMNLLGAVADFSGIVNDSRVDTFLEEDIYQTVANRANSKGLGYNVVAGVLKSAVVYLQDEFNKIKLVDIVDQMGASFKKRTESENNAPAADQVVIQPSVTKMQERMDQLARNVILNFANTTPDPYMYPYSHLLSIDTTMLRMNGTFSSIGFSGLARDLRLNVSSSPVAEPYASVHVSMEIYGAELTGRYNLEGSLVAEFPFAAQGPWSIQNITVYQYLFDPRMELADGYLVQRSTLMSGFRMHQFGFNALFPGLLDSTGVSESVRKATSELIGQHIIKSLYNNGDLASRMQGLVADEIYARFGEIPAVDIILG